MKVGEKYKSLQISDKTYLGVQRIRFKLIEKKHRNVTFDETISYLLYNRRQK